MVMSEHTKEGLALAIRCGADYSVKEEDLDKYFGSFFTLQWKSEVLSIMYS